jgi:hypothetical protein
MEKSSHVDLSEFEDLIDNILPFRNDKASEVSLRCGLISPEPYEFQLPPGPAVVI